MSKNSNLYNFAKHELDILLDLETEENKKEPKEDLDYEKELFNGLTMQESMNKDILSLIEAIPEGHSGFSMNYLLSCFNRLMNFENLTPLTLSDDEFVEVAREKDDKPLYQNIRNCSVFKSGDNIYHLDGQAALDKACGKEADSETFNNTLLSKDEFVCYINTLKDINDASEALDKALSNYDETSDFSGFSNFRAIGIVEDLLSKLMYDEKDEYGYSTISYFIADLDFGRKYYEGCFTESDGTFIDISTPEKLYDFLVKTV